MTRACATLRVAVAVVALALGLAACGGDDSGDKGSASTTATKAERTRTAPAPRKGLPAPKVPAEVAEDVAAVRGALEDAGFTVKTSRGARGTVAQLQVGNTLVSFYREAEAAAEVARGLRKTLEQAGKEGQRAVRASDRRLYLGGGRADERFAKIVSTSEAALEPDRES